MKTCYSLMCLVLLFTAISCGKDDQDNPISIEFPENFKLNGSAEGWNEKRNISCSCDQFGTLSSKAISNDTTVFKGTMGGAFSRTSLNKNGEGIQLNPDTYGEIIIKIFGDSVWIITPIGLDADSRFWREVSFFKGIQMDGLISGHWKCAPFDIHEGGWVDTLGTVIGKWHLESLDE